MTVDVFPARTRPSLRPRWTSVAIVAATLIALGDPGFPIRAHLDTVRDQLRVRDCVERGICAPLETTAQRDNLFHGPIWMQFLIATRRAGLDAWEQRMVTVGLLGVAAAVVDAWVSTTFAAGMGLIAAALFVDCSLQWTQSNLLYNPSLLALPCSLFYAAISGLLASGSVGWAALSGLALCLCIDVHVAGLALLPPLAAAAVFAPRRPLLALVAAIATLATSAAALSGAVWLNNLRSANVSVPILLAAFVAALAAAAIRHWWLVLPALARQFAFISSIGVYFGLAAVILVTVRGWVAFSYYFLFVAPAVALAGAAIFEALLRTALRFTGARRRGPLAIVAIGCAVLVVALDCRARMQTVTPPGGITLEDGRRLAELFDAQGWTYSKLRFALRGPGVEGYEGLLAAIAPFMRAPPDSLRPTADGAIVRIIATESPDTSPFPSAGWQAVPIDRERTALISPLRAWIRESNVRILIDGREWRPPLAPPPAGRKEMIRFSDLDRLPSALPLGVWGSVGADLPPGRVLTVELGVEASPPDAEHSVLLIAGCSTSSWTIAEVEGIRQETSADGTSVLLHREASHNDGIIRFAYARRADEAPQRWNDPAPLHFVETREGEDAIVAQLRRFGRPCH